MLQSNGTKNMWLDVSSIVKSSNLEQIRGGVSVIVPPIVLMYGWEEVNVTSANDTDTNGTSSKSRLARYMHMLCVSLNGGLITLRVVCLSVCLSVCLCPHIPWHKHACVSAINTKILHTSQVQVHYAPNPNVEHTYAHTHIHIHRYIHTSMAATQLLAAPPALRIPE
jgi:hypothetical protein